MLKGLATFAAVVVLGLAVLGLGFSTKPSMAGSWQVDTRHSAVQLITDGTTDYGKTKLDFTLGFARVNGEMKIDDADAAKSSVVFRFYPANSMAPPIAENGKLLSQWLADEANNTLICFHSKTVERTADGRVQASGVLTLTRVDRNVQAEPTEAYSGPVYGPPIVHRVSRDATFVFDFPADASTEKGEVFALSTLNLSRENFPQLVKAVAGAYWPPVVQDEKCENPSGSTEDFRGFRCTGTFMEASGLPAAPGTSIAEDFSGPPSDFNAVAGNHLSIVLRMRLMPKASAGQAAGMN